MSDRVEDDRFYDMLFEMSNDIRHNILLMLLQKPERMTTISKVLELTSPEVSRHLSRLTDNKLIEKDSDNFYYVTNYGKYLLNSLVDLEFITKHQAYFLRHSAVNIPIKFQKRMSEISNYRLEENFMSFLRFINEKIKESEKYVWLYIDQPPILAIDAIRQSLEKGVKYKIIEQTGITGSDELFDKKHFIGISGEIPNIEIKKHPKVDIYLFISDRGSAIAFPTKEGFDYTGFIHHEDEVSWIKDLFNHYWEPTDQTTILCTLCSSPIRTDPIIEVIDGKECLFDTEECVLTYKRLKQIYGKRFE
jgi:predicted transcriptional regulator